MSRMSVLRLYRQILRIGRSWEAVDPKDSVKERAYIISEARRLFEANSSLRNDKEVAEKVDECKIRIELAQHYGIPYPRLYHTDPNTVIHQGTTVRYGRAKQSRAGYMDSYYNK